MGGTCGRAGDLASGSVSRSFAHRIGVPLPYGLHVILWDLALSPRKKNFNGNGKENKGHKIHWDWLKRERLEIMSLI